MPRTKPSRKPFHDEPDLFDVGFVLFVRLVKSRVPSSEQYPFTIPAVRNLGRLDLHPKVTYIIGENGSGKSTLIEAIAVAAGFNAEGGTKNFNFATKRTDSDLSKAIQLVRGCRHSTDGFFLRAESIYNVATELDSLRYTHCYGGKSLHAQSHGESFLAIVENRFGGNGLYIMDEPESALSPSRQLRMLSLIHDQVSRQGSQFIIATHSPILMAYPDSMIYELSQDGIHQIKYEHTEHFRLTRSFLNDPESFLQCCMDGSS